MQVTEISAQGLKREFRIVVPAGDIAKQVDGRLAEMARTAQIPGFRPGRVPTGLLRKQYGQALLGEALEKSVQEGAQKAIEDRGLKPALQPKVDIKEFGEGKDLEFQVALEVLPEIGKVDFAAIELERLKAGVEDVAVEDGLKRIAQANREFKPVDPARPARKGDKIKLDFVGEVGGTPFPGGAAQGYEIELGSGSLIPGFEDQLEGAEAGKECEVKVVFPADYGSAELAGKDAVFKCTILEISEAAELPIDAELAKKVGMETLEELRKTVRERIEQDYAQISRAMIKRKLLDKLAAVATFEVPTGLVDAEFEEIWKQVDPARKDAAKPAAAEGEVGEPAKAEPETEEQAKLRAEYRGIADRRVRLGLLLAEVGRGAKIEVSPEEINRSVMREAMRFPGQERMVFDFYQKNPEMRDRLRAPIYEDKTIDYILELAKVAERSVTPDELMAAARAGEEDDEKKAA